MSWLFIFYMAVKNGQTGLLIIGLSRAQISLQANNSPLCSVKVIKARHIPSWE